MPFAYYNIYELVPNVRSTPSKRSLNDPDITDGALVILHHISSWHLEPDYMFLINLANDDLRTSLTSRI